MKTKYGNVYKTSEGYFKISSGNNLDWVEF